MITKKVCLVGDFGVGKTSLVARYVNHTFSDRYLTTVGVSIKTRIVTLDNKQQIKFIIWDIAGEDTLSSATERYIKGADGLLLVADGTRQDSDSVAQTLLKQAQTVIGKVPYVSVINKADLVVDWKANISHPGEYANTIIDGHIFTSAKSGVNVEFAFSQLAAHF